MAKQSGLHQIKGKVGEYSYYKQTGVVGGLIRSINQGLSARVKTDEAYANTRLNNQEFGAACNVAGLLGKCVTPKFRPMILPFSQSKMAQDILKVAREHTENWGQRVVTSTDVERLCEILSSMSKRDASEFVTVEVDRSAQAELDLVAKYTAEQATLMSSLGITNLSVVATQFDVATGQWVPAAEQMTTGYLFKRETSRPLDDSAVVAGTGQDTSETMSVDTFIPAPNHSGFQIVVFVVMPARAINSVSHILQEFCSFIAMPVPAYVP